MCPKSLQQSTLDSKHKTFVVVQMLYKCYVFAVLCLLKRYSLLFYTCVRDFLSDTAVTAALALPRYWASVADVHPASHNRVM